MKLIACIAVAWIIALACFAAEPKFEPIFNGRDLSGWRAAASNPWWSVADGVLIGKSTPDKKGSVLETKKLYKNVVLQCDVRWQGDIDSGIFLRKGQKLQCQLGTSRSLKKDMTCSIYNGTYKGHEARGVDKLLKPGDWNKVRFEARGPKFKIWLNDHLVLEWESPNYPDAGPIGLQIHPDVKMKVEFRNLEAAVLEDVEQ